MHLILEALKPFHRIIKNRSYLKFYWLSFKYFFKPRKSHFVAVFGKYNITVVDNLSFLWQYREIFCDRIYNFKTNNAKPVILDIGSNIGMSLLYFKQNYPNAEIHAMEADPVIFRVLSNNLQRNNLTKGVSLVKAAAWIHSDGVSFNSDQVDGGHISESSEGIKLPSIDLKTYIQRFPKIDFAKIDIEGAENVILPYIADELPRIEKLFIEYHSQSGKNQNLSVILGILEKHKYRYEIHSIGSDFKRLYEENLNPENNFDLQLNIFAYKYES